MTCLVPALLSLAFAQTSEAEKLARLERSLAAGRQQLEQLLQDQEATADECRQAQAEFSTLDQRLTKPNRDQAPPAEDQQRERASLRARWSLARERFDLALRL